MYALYGWLSDSDSDSEDEGVLQTQLPKIDAEEVDPYRLAMLLYEPSCQARSSPRIRSARCTDLAGLP